MRIRRAMVPVASALICGIAIGWFFNDKQPVYAGGSTDRHDDTIMATGPVNPMINGNSKFMNVDLDGLWILDYKTGKLMGSTINRQTGKMVAFSEVDLVKEFEIAPRSNVHFIMTTGQVLRGQSVLYLLETSTGRLGTYSMVSTESRNGGESITISRVDMTGIRSNTMPPPTQVYDPNATVPPQTSLNRPNQYLNQMPQVQQPPAPQMPVPQQPSNLQQTGGVFPPGK